jgi:F1F0 ATPase subunit 2
MSEPIPVALALAAGMLLGALFFGGLWWTVRRGMASPSPALWFLCSLPTRLGVVLTGFYYVGGEDWQRWLPCLVGFMLARSIVKHRSRSRQASYAS